LATTSAPKPDGLADADGADTRPAEFESSSTPMHTTLLELGIAIAIFIGIIVAVGILLHWVK
jgi:hypothetical protein